MAQIIHPPSRTIDTKIGGRLVQSGEESALNSLVIKLSMRIGTACEEGCSTTFCKDTQVPAVTDRAEMHHSTDVTRPNAPSTRQNDKGASAIEDPIAQQPLTQDGNCGAVRW